MFKIKFMFLMVALSLMMIGCNQGEPTDQIKPDNPQTTSSNGEDTSSTEYVNTVDFRGKDLTSFSFKTFNPLDNMWFDSRTKWSEKLPDGFNPSEVLEFNKNPGLNINYLHSIGVTGKGVNIAIIDAKLLIDHVEYGSRLKLYEEIHITSPVPQMHSSLVTSVASGKTTGVAPEAGIYFIATENPGLDFKWFTESIQRIIEINRTFPIAEKIRVLSISTGCSPVNASYNEFIAAIRMASKEGIFVVSGNFFETYDNFSYYGLDMKKMDDKDKTSSYVVTPWEKWLSKVQHLGVPEYYKSVIDKNTLNNILLIPLDCRTTASEAGKNDYVFYGVGGWSTLIPYLAGVYTLACQVKPDITPEIFLNIAIGNGEKRKVMVGDKKNTGTIINPVKIVEILKAMN